MPDRLANILITSKARTHGSSTLLGLHPPPLDVAASARSAQRSSEADDMVPRLILLVSVGRTLTIFKDTSIKVN